MMGTSVRINMVIAVRFTYNQAQNKEETTYKSLYIKKSLVEKIDRIAFANNTSWNNIVISMIEYCLENEDA